MRFAIIIGAQRAGTTSLFQYLRQHPEISGCAARKQTDFFTLHWDRDFDWYRSLWEWNSDQHEWALEASPSYTMVPHRPNASERIAQIDTEVRFIYLLRDPVDRIRSHYHHGLYCGEVEEGLSFKEALDSHPELLDFSRYATQISRYDRKFSKEHTLLLTLEHLKTNPEATLRRVCGFLGIDADFSFSNLNREYNTRNSRGRPSLIYKALQSIEPLRENVREFIPLHWRDKVREYFYKKEDGIVYPELSYEESAHIIGQLRNEIEKLDMDRRVDISHWKTS